METIVVEYGCESAGNLTRIVDGVANATVYNHNEWSLVESVVEPSTTPFRHGPAIGLIVLPPPAGRSLLETWATTDLPVLLDLAPCYAGGPLIRHGRSACDITNRLAAHRIPGDPMTVLRRVAYWVAVRDVWEPLVRSTRIVEGLAYQSALRFVGGRTLEEALEQVTELVEQGFDISLDFFGEGLDEPSRVDEVLTQYGRAAEAMSVFDGRVDLELVPSHLGIDHSTEFFVEHAAKLGAQLPYGTRLQVSAEESHRTDRIVAGSIQLRERGIPVATTVQANLRRSPADIERLIGAGVGIRLVKGAYLEDSETAHAWGEPTDLAFVTLAQQISDHGIPDVALATHDPVLREALLPTFASPTVEMLLGVRHQDAVGLIERGIPVRLYVPFGDDWFRYWVRRRVEAL